MRIITGNRKGLKLLSPKGDYTRPTEGRIKESIFNILGNVSESVVLDLFSGSGGIGLEFLSRGASEVFFIDNNNDAISIIKKNIAKANLPNTRVLNQDYRKALKYLDENNVNFDYVYIDPPYSNLEIYENVLTFISKKEIFTNSLIIVESNNSITIENINLFNIIDVRNYRDTIIYFLRRK